MLLAEIRTRLWVFPSFSQRYCRRRPSTIVPRPFDKYFTQFSAAAPQTSTSKYETSVTFWPLLVYTRLLAIERLHTDLPEGVYFNSGSRVRFPIMLTLFKLIVLSFLFFYS